MNQKTVHEFTRALKRLAFLPVLLWGAQAFGWSATFLGGGNWAIICANGTAWSYSGSSAGLDVVGPALCPAGMAEPNIPGDIRVTKGLSANTSVDLVRNRKEVGDRGLAGARTYPPHGYPCLGCAPCPGNPTEFCDINNLRLVVVPQTNQCRADNPANP